MHGDCVYQGAQDYFVGRLGLFPELCCGSDLIVTDGLTT